MTSQIRHRKTRRRFEVASHPRFLTFSCFHRLPLFSNDPIKQTYVDQLRLSRERLGFRLLAWVIMPEHDHLVIVPNEHSGVTSILSALKRPFATRVLARWRDLHAPVLDRIRSSDGSQHFWQAGGGYDRNLVSPDELAEKTEYCGTNPQRAAW